MSNKLFKDETGSLMVSQLQDIAFGVGEIARGHGSLRINTYRELKNKKALLSIGDQISVNRTTAVSATVSGTGITAATVDLYSFIHALGTVPVGIYQFVNDSGAWFFQSRAVQLSEFGITVTGTAADGDVINVTTTGYKEIFDVVNKSAAGNVTLLAYNTITTGFAFSEKQALVVALTDLPAGTYNITLNHGAYGGSTAEDGTYQFTTTVQVPAGGYIRHSNMGISVSGEAYSQERVCTGVFTTYGTDGAVLEDNLVTTVGSDGTNLGTTTYSDPQYKVGNNVNFASRGSYGSSRYSTSGMDQWINSDKKNFSDWQPKTIFDFKKPTTQDGYLYGLDPDFVDLLESVGRKVGLYQCDGGGYEVVTEKVFLPSCVEVGLSSSYANEGEVAGYTVTGIPFDFYVGAENADRIKKDRGGSTRLWRLRTCIIPYETYSVNTSGARSYSLAYYAYPCAPGLNF